MPATFRILPSVNGVISGISPDGVIGRGAPRAVGRAVADTEPVSLDSRSAQRGLSLPPAVRYELRGVAFTLPPLKSLPLDLRERADGDMLAILRLALGEDRIKELVAAGLTVGDLDLICEDWCRRNGVEAELGPLFPRVPGLSGSDRRAIGGRS